MPKANLTRREVQIIADALDFFISDGGINMSDYRFDEVSNLAIQFHNPPIEQAGVDNV